MPKVSIIIPCYNDGRHLVEAVGSALGQTGVELELLIVDDHSTERGTLETLEALRAEGRRVLRTPQGRKGVCAARNAGIAAATADYVITLDADDRLAPTYAARTAAVMEANPDVAVCSSAARCFGEVRKKWRLPPYRYEDLLFNNCLHCAAMFRRADWAAVGGYDENLALGLEDWAFWIAILSRGGRAHRIDDELFFYRIRRDSRTAQMKRQGEAEAVRAVFDSQRRIYEQNAWLMFGKVRELESRLAVRRLVAFRLLSPLFLAEEWLRRVLSSVCSRLRAVLLPWRRP